MRTDANLMKFPTLDEGGIAEAQRIGKLAQSGEQMVERLRRTAFLPDSKKALQVRIGIAEAAELLGCSTNRIRMAEQDGRLPTPPETQSGRRLGYDIPTLLNMRDVLGASPRRGPNDIPAIITVQNFNAIGSFFFIYRQKYKPRTVFPYFGNSDFQ